METVYNVENIALAEPSLKRNIVPNAKRIENFAPLAWRAQPDSLWRHLPDSSVLQETEIEMALAKKCSLPSAFNLFSPRGFSSCYHLWPAKKRRITLLRISERWIRYDFRPFAKNFRNKKTESPVSMRVLF